jgi:hypothetical protein
MECEYTLEDADAARAVVAEYRTVVAAIRGALWAAEQAREHLIGEPESDMSLVVGALEDLASELSEAADQHVRWVS